MQRLTEEQAIVVTGFTGVLAGSFAKFHKDLEQRMGRPVFTHEMGDVTFFEEIKHLYKKDFIGIVSEVNKNVY